jgi:hypothetical protein
MAPADGLSSSRPRSTAALWSLSARRVATASASPPVLASRRARRPRSRQEPSPSRANDRRPDPRIFGEADLPSPRAGHARFAVSFETGRSAKRIHSVSGLIHGAEVFADAGRPQEQHVQLVVHEAARREVDDLGLRHVRVEMEVESSRVLCCSKLTRRTRCSSCFALAFDLVREHPVAGPAASRMAELHLRELARLGVRPVWQRPRARVRSPACS